MFSARGIAILLALGFLVVFQPSVEARITAVLQTDAVGEAATFVEADGSTLIAGGSLFLVYRTTNAHAGFNPANPLQPHGGDRHIGSHRLNEEDFGYVADGQIVGHLTPVYEEPGGGHLYLAVFAGLSFETFNADPVVPLGTYYLLTTGALVRARSSEDAGVPTALGQHLARHAAMHGPFVADRQTMETTDPTLVVEPLALSFASVYGQSPSAQTVMVRNTGSTMLAYTSAVAGAAWLSVVPSSGTVGGTASAANEYRVNSPAMDVGVYDATVTVSSAEALGSPQEVAVSLEITPAAQAITQFLPADGSDLLVGEICEVSALGGASGNPVTFSHVPGYLDVTWVSSNRFLPLGTGEVRIAATQAGSMNYSAAPTVTNIYAVTGDECLIAVAPDSFMFGSGQSTGLVSLVTGADCAWTATTGDEWITLDAEAGTGPVTLTIIAAKHDKRTERTGTVTVRGASNEREITVEQGGKEGGSMGWIMILLD